MRNLLAMPTLLLGILLFKISEFIANKKKTYRALDVIEILQPTAKCTECGHEGAVFSFRGGTKAGIKPKEICEHNFIDISNEIISSGEICIKCRMIKK